MSMIFTPLVKVPTITTATTTSTKSSTSSVHDEPQNLPKSKPQASVFLLAKNLASKYNGECLSTNYSICKGKNALKFHCVNTHTFFIPVEDIVASSNDESSNCSWCYRCEKFFEQCQQIAKENGLRIIDGLYSSKITLSCELRQHQFTISYSKKLSCLSCADCRKEEREEWKEQLRQEEAQRNELFQR